MKATTILVVAVLAGIAAAPAALAASHGITWTANGVAVGPAGQVAQVTVHFHGAFSFTCPPGYDVTLKDATGAILEQRTFNGYQVQTELPSGEQYQETFTSSGASSDAGVAFSWSGVQQSWVNASPVDQFSQAIAGKYQGWNWAAITVLQPISFGTC
ncbi:MAG TPA: hypothetical protein VGR28_15190 [Candidatus Thermoplasmatota archaeon]|jgi:hypothetical protein|nr:hypothetical protein [Candidatus Thermoplasmatota archaeon]